MTVWSPVALRHAAERDFEQQTALHAALRELERCGGRRVADEARAAVRAEWVARSVSSAAQLRRDLAEAEQQVEILKKSAQETRADRSEPRTSIDAPSRSLLEVMSTSQSDISPYDGDEALREEVERLREELSTSHERYRRLERDFVQTRARLERSREEAVMAVSQLELRWAESDQPKAEMDLARRWRAECDRLHDAWLVEKQTMEDAYTRRTAALTAAFDARLASVTRAAHLLQHALRQQHR